jgi:hypothetical protein
MNSRPCHIIWFYRCSYTCIRIQLNVSPSLFDISRQFDVPYNPLLVPYTPHISRISLYKLQTLSYHMFLPLFIYMYKNSTYRISVAIYISRQFDMVYNPLLVPYTRHITRFSLYKLQTLSYHMILPLFIYMYKNSTYCISVAIYISRQFGVPYNPLLVPYTPHVPPISLYELQTLSYHMILLLSIYRYKYSVYRISVAISHI